MTQGMQLDGGFVLQTDPPSNGHLIFAAGTPGNICRLFSRSVSLRYGFGFSYSSDSNEPRRWTATSPFANGRPSSFLACVDYLNDSTKDSFGLTKFSRQLHRDNKKLLDLLAKEPPASGFDSAVQDLFGTDSRRTAPISIGRVSVGYSALARDVVNFLPIPWQNAFDRTATAWPGCEKWWTGYPLIALVEIRASDGGWGGDLRVNAEVGPLATYRIRQAIVETIAEAAAAQGLYRIRFSSTASSKGQLYSRFLHKNAVAVEDRRDGAEIKRKLVALINDFQPEFDLVAGIIPTLSRLSS